MNKNDYNMYTGGEWVSTGDTFTDYNPASAEVWAEISDETREDARRAIQAVAAAQIQWAAIPHPQWAGYLFKAADIPEKRQMDFVNPLIKANPQNLKCWYKGES